MADFFPPLEAPQLVVLTRTATTLRVQWRGAAVTYRLWWRRQESSLWKEVVHAGPGASGSAGLFPSDGIEPVTSSTVSAGAAADFTLTGLTPGMHDLRLYNVATDGTAYLVKRAVAIEAPLAAIAGFAATGTGNTMAFSWTPTGVAGPYLVHWRSDGGEEGSAEVLEAALTIEHLPDGAYQTFVAQVQPNGQVRYSERKTVEVGCCGGAGGAFDGSTLVGPAGPSAYQLAVAGGFLGTEAAYLASLVGPPGPPGSSAGGHVHTQSIAANEWTIVHNLGKEISAVRVEDSLGEDWYGRIINVDLNTIKVNFGNSSFGGKAYII